MEALACGVPVVTFEVGGLPDMVTHKENGYLAQPNDVADLAAGIAWTLAETSRLQVLHEVARRKAEANFAIQRIAARYHDLYTTVMDTHH